MSDILVRREAVQPYRITDLESAQDWQRVVGEISTGSLELKLFRSWLNRYTTELENSSDAVSEAADSAQIIGALAVPFAIKGDQFHASRDNRSDKPQGFGWFVDRQRVRISGSDYSESLIMGYEVPSSYTSFMRTAAVNGLMSVLRDVLYLDEIKRPRTVLSLVYGNQSICSQSSEALQRAGFNSTGNTEVLESIEATDPTGVGLLPEADDPNKPAGTSWLNQVILFEKKTVAN